ncbi:MAG TPA: hypothetical protein VF796_27080, partial [Humisphaera sp.]
RTVALALLLVGLGLVVMPEALRAARGWPANGNLYPPVVGPGDTTRVYMNEKIESVKGYWRGTPRVTATVPGGPPIPLECSTNQKDWGSSISAKSSEKSSSSTLWVELTMPPRPELAGTTVKCDVALDVIYPKSVGSSTFDEMEKTITQPIEIRTATANAGGQYNSMWWLGTAGGAGLILVCGQILRAAADAYAKQARPTRTFA